MKTTLAGPSPIDQFIGKLKDSGIDIDSTRFDTFKVGALPTQAYMLDGGYRLLLTDTRGWLLRPDQSIGEEMKLLPESEMDKSVEYVRQQLTAPAIKPPLPLPLPLPPMTEKTSAVHKDGEITQPFIHPGTRK